MPLAVGVDRRFPVSPQRRIPALLPLSYVRGTWGGPTQKGGIVLPKRGRHAVTGKVFKLCSFAGCHALVRGSKYCAAHRRWKDQVHGYRHRQQRQAVFEAGGWRCHYCGEPVTRSDDIVHWAPTQSMSAAESWAAPKAPAHRACHNRWAPHLRGPAGALEG